MLQLVVVWVNEVYDYRKTVCRVPSLGALTGKSVWSQGSQ